MKMRTFWAAAAVAVGDRYFRSSRGRKRRRYLKSI